jgi:histidinol-phosphate aminotransferase
MDIKRLVKPNVLSLHAYETSEVPCRVKLDANESPYGFKAIRSVRTNRYPDPEARELRSIVARQFRVRSEMILHGNGSDELISCLITAFGGPVLFPVPTFSMYGIISRALGEESFSISLDEKFDIDLKAFLRQIRARKPKLIFISSPNNPTGNSFSHDRIAAIISVTRGLVVVDEAYQAFSSRKSFLTVMKEHGNLVILKTLSKTGMAGLRIGFLIARPEIIREVNKVRLPFNVNAVSQELAVSALKRKEVMRLHVKSVISERKMLYSRMKEMKGVEPWPSDANFILFRVNDSDGVFRGLLESGVLIRNMKGIVDGCLRVTVGTPRENKIFLSALKRVVKAKPTG